MDELNPKSKPSIGRVVHYQLTLVDADAINRRRVRPELIAGLIDVGQWPEGIQAHVGNECYAGEILPCIVTKVWADNAISGQVLLDGNDTLWVTTVPYSPGSNQGAWTWPPRVEN